MNLRVKLVLAMVALAAGATVLIGATSYASTENELRNQIDSSLEDAAAALVTQTPRPRPGIPDPPLVLPRNFTRILVQRIDADGSPESTSGTVLPVGDPDRAIAAGAVTAARFRDVRLDDGEPFRVLTFPARPAVGGAYQVARSLEETESTLVNIRNRTIVIVVAVSLVALALGLLVSRQITRRLVRLTDVATGVARSGQLDVEVPVDGRDETGRLGGAFRDMLGSLARSRAAQQRLIQDAGHELRTPLTSLRTNISVMGRYEELSPQSRARLLEDLDLETRELTALVDELVELATDRRDDEAPTDVVLADLVATVVDRVGRRTGRRIDVRRTEGTSAEPVRVRPQAIERAVSNLVENAAKFSDGPIGVVVGARQIDVLDRGPGIAEDDLERIFDRFYRSIGARSKPGSGLGLSIVRQIVESHGGTVRAANREGGGAAIGFTLA